MTMPDRHSAKDVLVVVDVQNDICEGVDQGDHGASAHAGAATGEACSPGI